MKNRIPFFSIILPVYNRAFIIKEAVESVCSQEFSDWELIIINDKSTDETEEVILPFLQDERIRYYVNLKNIGAAGSRNVGIRHAQGMFISFLDSDNRFDIGFLSKFYAIIVLNKQADIFWCGVKREVYKGNKLFIIEEHHWKPNMKKENFFLQQIRTSTGRGLVVSKEACIKVGFFDETLPAAEDTEFLLRLFKDFNGMWIGGYLYNAVIHENDRLSTDYNKQAQAYRLIIKKHLEFFKQNAKDSGRFFRKGAYYNYLSGNRIMAYKLLFSGVRINFLDYKYYYYLIRFLF